MGALSCVFLAQESWRQHPIRAQYFNGSGPMREQNSDQEAGQAGPESDQGQPGGEGRGAGGDREFHQLGTGRHRAGRHGDKQR